MIRPHPLNRLLLHLGRATLHKRPHGRLIQVGPKIVTGSADRARELDPNS
jgi:hypothetical protein